MKAIFKKMAVVAISLTLIVLMALSVMPMVFADEEAPKAEPTFELEKDYEGELTENLSKMNVSLSGRVTLKLTYEITEKHGYIEITVPDANRNPVKRTIELTDADYTAGKIEISVSLAAAQQTELIKFQWFGKNGEAGKWRKYSVKYYAGKIMDMASGDIPAPEGVSDETVAKMDQTVKSMLNYGAMAQVINKYNTDNLANAGLYTDENNPVNNMTVDHLYDAVPNEITEENKTVFKGVNVFLDTDVRIRIYVDVLYGTKATVDGNEVTVSKDKDGCYIGIYNIPATKFNHAFKIEVEGQTIEYSVLGWCISTLESYRTDAEYKNIARSLYSYYAFTTQFATREDEKPYTPGPKEKDKDGKPIIDQPLTQKDENGNTILDENGNPVLACNHERYSLSADKKTVICADCGKNISDTTRISLDPVTPQFTIDEENGFDVTFLLNVVGAVDLSALCVTPVVDGLELTNPRLAFTEHEGNLQGDAALNIVLDAAAPITEGCTLVKVTYNVKATKGIGSYKINLTVNEAYASENKNVADKIVPVVTILEAIAPDCQCAEKTGFDATDKGHRWYCDECQQVGEWEAHNTTDVLWTHVKGEMDKNGKIYEEKICTVCQKTAEKREVYYYSNADTIYAGNTVINDNGKGQTAGFHYGGHGYPTFVVSSDNFKDKDGNALHVTDTFKVSGWFGVNGGVDRYVVQINDGAWVDLVGAVYNAKSGDKHIGDALLDVSDGKFNANDDSVFAKSNYQNKLSVPNLQNYANQTVTIKFAAVPAGNPGTAENPNVLIIGIVENLFIECTHLGNAWTETETKYEITCTCKTCGETVTKMCEHDITTTWNTKINLYESNCAFCSYFATSDMLHKSEAFIGSTGHAGSAGEFINATQEDDFIRYTPSKTVDDPFFTVYSNGTAVTGKYAVIKYRLVNENKNVATYTYHASSLASGYTSANGDSAALNSSSQAIDGSTLIADGKWHYVIVTPSDDNKTFTANDDGTFTWRYLRITVAPFAAYDGTCYIDIDEIAFADSEEAAAIYADRLNTVTINFDHGHNLIDGQKYITADKRSNGTMVFNMSQYASLTTPTSLKAGGWVCTRGGIDSYKIRVTKIDGVEIENPTLTDWVSNASKNFNDIYTVVGKALGYSSDCAKGCKIDGAKVVDLTAYQGKTIEFEIVAISNYGAEIIMYQYTNVVVPNCPHPSFVDHAYIAPTDKADGNYAYKVCSECGKIWSAAGEELDAVPTIAKIVPTTNKYWGYEDMKGWNIGANFGNKVDTKPSDDHSFVRFERTASVGDVYALFLSGNTSAVTGQYLVIKYRTDHAKEFQFFVNTEGGVDGSANFTKKGFQADEQWHIAIIDLAAEMTNNGKGDYFKAETNGTYIVQSARIDLLNEIASEGYVDVGFIVLTDDVSKVGSVLIDGDENYCPHVVADNAVWTPVENDPAFSEKTSCIICGGDVKKYVSDTADGLLLWTPDELCSKTNGWSNGNVTINNDNGLPYVHYEYIGAQTTTVGECVANLYGNIADPLKVGKYAAILYRTTHTGSIEVYANSNSDSVNGPNVNFGSNTDNLNEWTFRVKEFPANADTTKYDAKQQTAVRLDWFNYTVNNPLKTGDTVDIAFIAYFDSEAEAYAFFSKYVKAYGEESWCDHKYINTEWVSAEKIYKTTCTICGNVETSDMLYKTEANTTDIGSPSNFLTATTKTEDGETFVRYTAGETDKTDLYFFPYRHSSTAVTGKYMVIKYRVSNGGGVNLSTGQIFASSAPSGNKPGDSGANQNIASSVWLDDGKWHTMIIQPKDANVTFTPNEDGTISWGYLRININGIKAGNYVDIAEIAFADSVEAAEYYACKNDPTVFFTSNLDHVKLGEDKTGDKGSSQEKPKSVDLSGKTVANAADGLKIKGWCVTPGGVAAYKLRVTSIDGKAVEDPELINWATATTVLATDGVTTQGTNRGFGTDCRLGARYNETAVNLSNWAGHTINFEIVAVTNYGAEVTIIQINNVTVLPAAE